MADGGGCGPLMARNQLAIGAHTRTDKHNKNPEKDTRHWHVRADPNQTKQHHQHNRSAESVGKKAGKI